MPFPASLSGGNQTTKRKGGVFERLLIVHTPSVQLQFHPSANASSNVTGTITFAATLSGAYTNVLLGMTVIISPTSDYAADLRNQPENCFVTYIRAAASATVLSIGATKYQYATGDFVTVLNDYRIFERKIRAISANDIRRDWDIQFRKPKPRIYNLYSTVVFAAPTVGTVAFTPSAVTMASSGSISTWLWDVDDGTITVGTSASQNITATFPIGTRYVHLTVTDSNGISNYLTALIVVLPTALTSVIHLDNSAFSVIKSLNTGNSIDFTVLANGAFLDGSQAIVATYANYNDSTTALTVSMIGWLKDIRDTITADNEVGRIIQASATIQGLAFYASQIQSEGFYTELKTTPSVWGEFGRLSLYDALWYLASEHSTLANVAAFDYPSDYTDYKFPAIDIPSGTILEVMTDLAFRAMGGGLNYSPNGELVFRTSLLYMTDDAGRNAADTYASYTTEDGFNFDYSRINNAEIKAVGQILLGCAVYDTTTKIPRVYFSKAPAGDESGYLIEELDSIVLPVNTTDANARLLAGGFTANHYFAINENPVINLSLIDGYYTIEPSSFQWHKFTIAVTDTVSNAILTTTERFICTEIRMSYNDALGQVQVSGTFRKETNGGTNYLQETSYVSTNTPNAQPFVPQFVPQPFLDTGVEDSDIYDTANNDASGTEGVQDPTLPPTQAGEAQGQSSRVLETLYVPMFANTSISSVNNLTNLANYLIRITGDGVVKTSERTQVFDFTLGSQLGWVPNDIGTGARASYTGTRWAPVLIGADYVLVIETAFTWPTDFVITTSRVWITINDSAVPFQWVYGLTYPNGTFNLGNPVSGIMTGTGDINKGTRTGIGVEYSKSTDTGQLLTRIEFDFTGVNGFTTGETIGGEPVRGDAFYWKYNNSDVEEYPATTGLFVNGIEPTAPAYSAGHVYELTVVGSGVPLPLQFYDPEGIYTDNDNVYLKVEIIAL